MNKSITVTVEIVREGGDRVAAYGRVTPAELAEGPTSYAPVWHRAANRAAAKALRGCGAEVRGRTFAFDSITLPQIVDRAGSYYQATAVDSRGAVMGRAMISVR
jgi:hypothetical protein